MVYVYFDTKVDQILTVYRNQYMKSKAVEAVCLCLTIFELEVF
jgi:hypothetical protein